MFLSMLALSDDLPMLDLPLAKLVDLPSVFPLLLLSRGWRGCFHRLLSVINKLRLFLF